MGRDEVTTLRSPPESILTFSYRSEPLLTMSYGSLANSRGKDRDVGAGDHVISVKFNQSETSMIASSGSDRTVCLYDVRTAKATSRLSMDVSRARKDGFHCPLLTSIFASQLRANQLSWNPLQPPVLLLASEDNNLYTFDIRKMTSATQVFKGHVAA